MNEQTEHLRTAVLVDLGAVRRNFKLITDRLPEKTKTLAVVKANGYGHGAVEVGKAALDAGADRLGVATIEEACELRDSGFKCQIQLLFEPPHEAASAKLIAERKITPTVYTSDFLRLLSEASAKGGIPVHVFIDTGMHREGMDSSGALSLIDLTYSLDSIWLEGVCTHMAAADEPENEFNSIQADRFNAFLNGLKDKGISVPIAHMGNSAAAIALPYACYNMVRVGIAAYGLYPSDQFASHIKLEPSLSWKTRISMVRDVSAGELIGYSLTHRLDRDSRIALLPIGYADGYMRILSNKSEVLIRGKRCKVVGLVCMDVMTVDVTETESKPGDEVVIIGKSGKERVTAEELAKLAKTINYEIVCTITKRVPRFYRE